MDRTVATQTWDVLANAIDEIYNRNASQLSFEKLYRNAYNLVLHKYGALLYEGVSEKVSSHLLETVSHLADVPDSSLLEEVATTWSEHQVSDSTSLISVGQATRLFLMLNCSVQYPDYHDHGSRHSDVHGQDVYSRTPSANL